MVSEFVDREEQPARIKEIEASRRINER